MTNEPLHDSIAADPAPQAVPQMQPHEIDALRREVASVPAGTCGLDREAALGLLDQLKELKLERDAFLAELVAAGLG